MGKIAWIWWKNLAKSVFSRKHYRRVRSIQSGVEPGCVKRDEIVLIGPSGRPKWAVLQCPCGCGYIIHVNLMRSHHPHWTISFARDGSISFNPSLWIDESRCGSHFLIKNGHVIWCDGAGSWNAGEMATSTRLSRFKQGVSPLQNQDQCPQPAPQARAESGPKGGENYGKRCRRNAGLSVSE